MSGFDLIIYGSEFRRFGEELERLRVRSDSKAVFLITRDGQLIASAGETGGLDTSGLAALAAANLAATRELTGLIGQRESGGFLLEGEGGSVQIAPIGQRLVIVVLFDSRTSVGLVRLRVKQAGQKFLDILREAELTAGGNRQSGPDALPFAGITDEDMDSLFSF
ncbi:MAG: roadblock/LC7 domain-containing protein [Nitrospiraceae bacterium]|nr:roadblock/LC7 domain-containing protein [Nitrospiraceae bacterium]